MSTYRIPAEQQTPPTYQDYLADPEVVLARVRAGAQRERTIALSEIAGELRRLCRQALFTRLDRLTARA